MGKDDSRYVGAFFNSYTNTRMKLHRHCVPLEDDPQKVSEIYGYSIEAVKEIYRQLDRDMAAAVRVIRDKYKEQLDKKLSGRTASFVFVGDQLTSEYLSYYNIIRHVFEPYENISVSIAGNTGDTSNQSVQYIYGLAVAKEPLVTSILIGTNDLYMSRDAYAKTVSSREEYGANIDYLTKVLLHNGSKVILNTLPPVDAGALEKAYSQMNWTVDNEEVRARNQIIRDTVRNNKCILNDMAEHFEAFDGPVTIDSNGVLLTKEAQAYMADKYLEVLLEAI